MRDEADVGGSRYGKTGRIAVGLGFRNANRTPEIQSKAITLR